MTLCFFLKISCPIPGILVSDDLTCHWISHWLTPAGTILGSIYYYCVSSVMWFRRDLRVNDHPALLVAGESGPVYPLFVFDPVLWDSAGPVRATYLLNSLASLNESLGGNLVFRVGDPAVVVPEFAREVSATSVHVSADYGPYGRLRDQQVSDSLHVPLVATGSPYAIAPGRVRKGDDTPYRVFTPFYRAWFAHGWRAPAIGDIPKFASADSHELPSAGLLEFELPKAGEAAALERLTLFRDKILSGYPDSRDHADLDGTSALSHHLKYGEIHPRTVLAEIGPTDEVFRKEICWREFYADVLFHNPRSARESLDARFDSVMPWASGAKADNLFDAWTQGKTGFPFVDAGMRQLNTTGWMHNRVRMVTASFLVKDLHINWQRGATYFMSQLRDGDLASNSHGWQWTAGCGTDASPFFRVFNPITQGLKFDPAGEYVRRYVPELAHLPGKTIHTPWEGLRGYENGYPEPIVDHKVEREVALADYALMKGQPR